MSVTQLRSFLCRYQLKVRISPPDAFPCRRNDLMSSAISFEQLFSAAACKSLSRRAKAGVALTTADKRNDEPVADPKLSTILSR